jgi:hypothetical protein
MSIPIEPHTKDKPKVASAYMAPEVRPESAIEKNISIMVG